MAAQRDANGRFISAGTRVEENFARLQGEAEKAAFNSYMHAAASIRKDAMGSIKKGEEPSAPGSPPHTRGRGRKRLDRAIRFNVDRFGAVIGPVASVVDQVGEAHEFGGQYKGTQFEKRPTMGPALERSTYRFAGRFEGSIGE